MNATFFNILLKCVLLSLTFINVNYSNDIIKLLSVSSVINQGQLQLNYKIK